MHVVVIEPPLPLVKPADIPGAHAVDDAFVTAMIAAAQADIDGPTGTLGRALGVQTLELQAECWPSSLPYRPVIDIVSVRVDGELVEGTAIEVDGCLRIPEGMPRPRESLRIRYRAGYDGKPHDEKGTGAVPANAKAAVILMVVGLNVVAEANGGLRSFAVDGAFTRAFNSPEVVDKVRTRAVDALLAPLRVFA